MPILARLLLSVLYTWMFVSFPWVEANGGLNPDTEQYLLRIENLFKGTDTDVESMNFVQYLVSEPLWREILILFGEYYRMPIDGLFLVSTVSMFVYAFFLFERVNALIVGFFLLNPLVVELVMFQVRSALALSICLIAIMAKNRTIGLLLIAVASTIHTVTFVLLFTYIFANYLEKKQSQYDYRLIGFVALFCGLIMAFMLGGGKAMILGALGDRRAEEIVPTASFVFLIFWFLLSISLVFIWREINFDDDWGVYFTIILFSMPFIMNIFSTNGVRFISLAFPIALVTINKIQDPARYWIFVGMFSYQLVQYVYWLKI